MFYVLGRRGSAGQFGLSPQADGDACRVDYRCELAPSLDQRIPNAVTCRQTMHDLLPKVSKSGSVMAAVFCLRGCYVGREYAGEYVTTDTDSMRDSAWLQVMAGN